MNDVCGTFDDGAVDLELRTRHHHDDDAEEQRVDGDAQKLPWMMDLRVFEARVKSQKFSTKVA